MCAYLPGKSLRQAGLACGIATVTLARGRMTFRVGAGRALRSFLGAFVRMGRITTLIETGQLFRDTGTSPFDPATDRVMICGSMDMIRDVKTLVEGFGLVEGSNAKPAEFVVERAFVG